MVGSETARSVSRELSIFKDYQKEESLLSERERKLESSHKELTEKLALVQNEIR